MTVPPSPLISSNPSPQNGVRVRTARRPFEGTSLFLTFLDGAEPDESLIEAGLERRHGRDGGCWSPLGTTGERAWVKGGRLTGKSALRHGARAFFAQRPLPRVTEFNNLIWLRLSGFCAAKPLVAGVLFGKRGLPCAQFLATLEVQDARNLAELFDDASFSEQARHNALVAAGELAADLHCSGFEHRDFYARNIVLDGGGALSLLDAWSGGPRSSARFSMRDTAGFLGDLQDKLGAHEHRLFLDAYLQKANGAIDVPGREQIDRAVQKYGMRLKRRRRR